MSDPAYLEGLACAVYEECGADPSTPVSPFVLARKMLGPDAIIRPPSIIASPAVLVVVNGADKIAIKRSVPRESAAFMVSHELSHWLLRREGLEKSDEERAANYLAGCLLAPRPAFRSALRHVGPDFADLAEVFSADETFAALRESEVTGRPRVVLARSFAWVRGDAWAWPDEQRLRTWARGKPGPGVRKTRLSDKPQRYVLDVEELEDVG
jgi:Zn-dependent peptidase ImmA (M78 family)